MSHSQVLWVQEGLAQRSLPQCYRQVGARDQQQHHGRKHHLHPWQGVHAQARERPEGMNPRRQGAHGNHGSGERVVPRKNGRPLRSHSRVSERGVLQRRLGGDVGLRTETSEECHNDEACSAHPRTVKDSDESRDRQAHACCQQRQGPQPAQTATETPETQQFRSGARDASREDSENILHIQVRLLEHQWKSDLNDADRKRTARATPEEELLQTRGLQHLRDTCGATPEVQSVSPPFHL
mmetsp:Transcript_48159/g.127528  ORF Transcript_48159/g.127528 Transcript_48159/m.127528 type:complete len:239 (+) Transcript_48159:670-1386(+)